MIEIDSPVDEYPESPKASGFEGVKTATEKAARVVGLAVGLVIGAATLPEGTPPHDIGERVPIAGAGVAALHEALYGDLEDTEPANWLNSDTLRVKLEQPIAANDAAIASAGQLPDSRWAS